MASLLCMNTPDGTGLGKNAQLQLCMIAFPSILLHMSMPSPRLLLSNLEDQLLPADFSILSSSARNLTSRGQSNLPEVPEDQEGCCRYPA